MRTSPIDLIWLNQLYKLAPGVILLRAIATKRTNLEPCALKSENSCLRERL
jgi:hypothetical protein